MEARMGAAGRREFIQVLRLMEDFCQHQVEQAVSEALRLGAISFAAVSGAHLKALGFAGGYLLPGGCWTNTASSLDERQRQMLRQCHGGNGVQDDQSELICRKCHRQIYRWLL
jgi:hypothetical protein